MKFTKIQGVLINLENVTKIEKYADKTTFINYVHGTNATKLDYDSKEERDNEFDVIESFIYQRQ